MLAIEMRSSDRSELHTTSCARTVVIRYTGAQAAGLLLLSAPQELLRAYGGCSVPLVLS